MASGAPYYQALAVQDQNGLSMATLDPATQSSLYPEPSHNNIDYQPGLQPLDGDGSEHAQLHDLVEAATSAAAQDQIRRRATRSHAGSIPMAGQTNNGLQAGSKRKLSGTLASDEDGQQHVKRARQSGLDSGMDQQPSDGPGNVFTQSSISPASHALDARSAGVHSAAALFRPPSDLSKKYTRPPMSKLYASLQLSPERFLHLQSAAKKYMLDSDHPERQACVGNRGKTDSGQVKLSLTKCVEDFLDNDRGDEFFGLGAEGPEDGTNREFIWPRDSIKIISLCVPLLRRMITNERQRQYANETRKGEKPNLETNGPSSLMAGRSNAYDPDLGTGPIARIYLPDHASSQALLGLVRVPLSDSVDWEFIKSAVASELSTIMGGLQETQLMSSDAPAIQVLTSTGLSTISDSADWNVAYRDILQTVWLDSTVKIIVRCNVGS